MNRLRSIVSDAPYLACLLIAIPFVVFQAVTEVCGKSGIHPALAGAFVLLSAAWMFLFARRLMQEE